MPSVVVDSMGEFPHPPLTVVNGFYPSILRLRCVCSASQTKVLHLEKENRELERTLQVLKQSTERAAAERDSAQKRLKSQIHEYRKEIAKLKEVCLL